MTEPEDTAEPTWVTEGERGDPERYELLAGSTAFGAAPSPFTPMGAVAGLGGFADDANRVAGWKRWTAWVLAVLVAGPVVVALVFGFFGLVAALFGSLFG
jgi:hypothetical protein